MSDIKKKKNVNEISTEHFLIKNSDKILRLKNGYIILNKSYIYRIDLINDIDELIEELFYIRSELHANDIIKLL